MNEMIMQFLLGMINSAIGAFFGFLLALYLQNRSHKRAKKNKLYLVIENIKSELSDISFDLQKCLEKNQPLKSKIQTPSWESILYSGIILELIEEPIYTHAIQAYSLINHHNEDSALLSAENNLYSIKEIVEASINVINQKGDAKDGKGKITV